MDGREVAIAGTVVDTEAVAAAAADTTAKSS
jgi:hypothetical protein